MSLPIPPIVTQDRVRALAESALPTAPVVPYEPRRHPYGDPWPTGCGRSLTRWSPKRVPTG